MTLVKPIIAILTSNEKLRSDAIVDLEQSIGSVDFIGSAHPFIHTEYYEPEMGADLKRNIISFNLTIEAYELANIKNKTCEIEEKFKTNGNRNINIDPGYLSLHQVVLASNKGGGHMLMISKNVYVDFLLWYNKGWQSLPWTYPDFKDRTYFDEFEKIRKMFKAASK